MNKKKPVRRLEFDDAPPTAGQKKIEAELRRLRTVAEALKPWMKAQIDHSVREAVREMKLVKTGK